MNSTDSVLLNGAMLHLRITQSEEEDKFPYYIPAGDVGLSGQQHHSIFNMKQTSPHLSRLQPPSNLSLSVMLSATNILTTM